MEVPVETVDWAMRPTGWTSFDWRIGSEDKLPTVVN